MRVATDMPLAMHAFCARRAALPTDTVQLSHSGAFRSSARPLRVGLRRREPSPLARAREIAADGHGEREGKIKGGARDCSRSERSCGLGAAPSQADPCCALHASLGALWHGMGAADVLFELLGVSREAH